MRPVKLAMMSINHGHARGYYDAFCSNPNFEPVAYSVMPGYGDRVFLERLPNVPMYHSDLEMLNNHPEIEACIISSQNNLHFEQMKLCVERGIQIYSMKVPTFDVNEYREMIQMCEKNDVICQVELELQYTPCVRRAKELIKEGKIGKVLSFNALNTSHDPVSWLPWHGIPEQSYGKLLQLKPGDHRYRGGALSDHPHIFDLVRYITESDFDYVYANAGGNVGRDVVTEDTVGIIGKMKNGMIFSLDPSFSRTETPMKLIGAGYEIYPKRVEVYMAIHGTKGSIFIDYDGPCVHYANLPAERFTTRIESLYADACQINEFADCVREHRNPNINLRSHFQTIQAMNACYESLSTSDAVKVLCHP